MIQEQPRFAPVLRALASTLRGEVAQAPVEPGVFQQFAELLASDHELGALLEHVLEQMALIARAERGFLALLDAQGQPSPWIVLHGQGDPRAVFPHSQTVVDLVLARKESLWIPDAQADERLHASDSVVSLDLRTVVAVPLRINSEVVGLVYLDRRSVSEQFQSEDLARLESMAAYATLAIHNMRSNQDMTSRVQKLHLINEVSLAINATLKLDELLALILQHSLSLSGGDQGYILLGDQDELTCLASRDRSGQPVEQIGISRSIVSRCIEEQRAICILDTQQDSQSQTRSVLAYELRSVMCVPLVANQQRIGVLYISSQAITKTFTPQDQSLLEAIANQAALTIRNAQLLDEQKQQIDELNRALQMVKEAQLRAVTDGLTGLYNHVFFKEQLYNSVLEAERYGHPLSVILVDLDHFKRINDTYGHQTGDEVLRQTSARIRELVRDCDVVSRYGGEELAILLPHTDQPGASVLADRIRSAIAGLSIQSVEGETLSVTASMGVSAHRPGLTATELVERADKALYVAKRGGRNRVCAHGQTVEISTEEAREIREALQEGFLHTVAALSEVAGAKDLLSNEHIEKGTLARLVGQKLGLNDRLIKELELGAVLHDVGKISIPDAILQKPGPLEPQEWEIVRSHAAQGARILKAGNLPAIAQMVRHHHERWDGSGYPDRLRGEEIPLGARIIAVIDAYGAMVTDRVYRKALTPESAVQELSMASGSQFDPRVVSAFLEVLAATPPSA